MPIDENPVASERKAWGRPLSFLLICGLIVVLSLYARERRARRCVEDGRRASASLAVALAKAPSSQVADRREDLHKFAFSLSRGKVVEIGLGPSLRRPETVDTEEDLHLSAPFDVLS